MTNKKQLLKIILAIVIFIIIGGYAYSRTKDFIRGPAITISSPENGSTVDRPLLEIKGQAKNVAHITIDDRDIFTDEEGYFSEKLLLYPGYNIISVKTRDRFERSKEKTLEIVYRPPLEPGAPPPEILPAAQKSQGSDAAPPPER